MSILEAFSLFAPGGGGVHMEGSTETQYYGFIENFEAKNVWDTADLVPKNMGNNFHRKVGQHKQFPV